MSGRPAQLYHEVTSGVASATGSSRPRPRSSGVAPEVDGPLKMQIASDLHLEFYDGFGQIPDDIIVPSAPILALLGDIALGQRPETLRRFLALQAKRFQAVLFLAGNHEFYEQAPASMSAAELRESFRAMCEGIPGVHWLDRASLLLGGVRVLGCTLWSDIPPAARKMASKGLSDFTQIYDDGMAPLTPERYCTWHARDLQWLRDELEAASTRGERCLVLTHHAPSLHGTSNPQYENDERNYLKYCFATDLEAMLGGAVHTWAYGHTHWNNDRCVRGTRLVSNQRGYKFNVSPSYRSNFVLEVPAGQHDASDPVSNQLGVNVSPNFRKDLVSAARAGKHRSPAR